MVPSIDTWHCHTYSPSSNVHVSLPHVPTNEETRVEARAGMSHAATQLRDRDSTEEGHPFVAPGKWGARKNMF